MQNKEIIKGLEKLAKKHGVDLLTETIEGIYCNTDVVIQTDPPVQCGPGKIYNEILKKCVDDL